MKARGRDTHHKTRNLGRFGELVNNFAVLHAPVPSLEDFR